MTKLQRVAEDEEFEAITEGIGVRMLAEDAMGKSRELHITIPPYGPFPDPQAIAAVLNDLTDGLPKTLAQAASYIQECAPAENPKPLSKDDFLTRGANMAHRALEVLDALPQDHQEAVRQALDTAFRAGLTLKEAVMRERHLPDVTREARMKRARKAGGDARKGHTEGDTEALLAFMFGKIAEGKKKGMAARLAFQRSPKEGGPLGVSIKANVERYRYWEEKRRRQESDRDQS